MTKRGIIQLSGTPKIRIAKPGVDVDTASETEFLLHEDHLYTQPYYCGFVANPFSGNTSKTQIQQDVNVTIPDAGSDPIAIVWPVDSTGNICYPRPRATGPGTSATGWAMEHWRVYVKVNSATSVTVRFFKTADSLRSPQGTYLILMRKPS